jgi:hypothetical protein
MNGISLFAAAPRPVLGPMQPPIQWVKNPWSYEGVSKKVSGLTAWRENCKWYSSLLLGAVVSLFCKSA